MTTLSSATGTISSAGIGSGLDVNSIVTKLMAVEQQPLTKLQTQEASLQAQLSAFGQLNSVVSQLKDATTPLLDPSTYALTTASSSDPSSVSAGTTSGAPPGVYNVSVSQLSASQSIVSPGGQYTDSTSPVGTGSITITLGTWNAGQTAFTPNAAATAVTIPITSDVNTLAGVRDKINAANAGVTATLVTDTTGTRIALQSSNSGAANGFRIQVVDDDGNNTDNAGLSRLAFDPAGGAGQMTLAQSSADTMATINGIAVTSASNTLTNVIDGMTFSVSKLTSQPVAVNVSRNTDAIKTNLTAFVTAYNAVNSFLAQATQYDASTKTAALLQGDSTATSVENQLHNVLSKTTGASSLYATFSALGLQLQKDGSLKMDDTKVSAALANLPEATKALSNLDATNASNNGLAKQFSDWADGLLQTGGMIPGKTDSIQRQIDSNHKDQDAMNTRLAAIQQRLQAQYSNLDTVMASSNALNSFMTQQIANWNKQTSSN
jgi:flagellar hook-associated protein 2